MSIRTCPRSRQRLFRNSKHKLIKHWEEILSNRLVKDNNHHRPPGSRFAHRVSARSTPYGEGGQISTQLLHRPPERFQYQPEYPP